MSSSVKLFRSPDENETRFGLCGRYPDWLQRFATPRTFLVAFCIKNILQGMVFSYIIGVETSVERHFKFDASTIGLNLINTKKKIDNLNTQKKNPECDSGQMLMATCQIITWIMMLLGIV